MKQEDYFSAARMRELANKCNTPEDDDLRLKHLLRKIKDSASAGFYLYITEIPPLSENIKARLLELGYGITQRGEAKDVLYIYEISWDDVYKASRNE